MKTAVEYLVKEFSDILGPLDIKPMQDLLLVDAIKRAKEMEKQQIIDAHGIKKDYSFSLIYPQIITGEQYYNETFKQQEQ
jgi:adenylate kinase